MPEEDWPADFGRLFGSIDASSFLAVKKPQHPVF
jgi:hypothetical protein